MVCHCYRNGGDVIMIFLQEEQQKQKLCFMKGRLEDD